VDRAQAEVFAVTESRISEDFLPLEALMTPALEEIEAIAGHDGSLSGAPTGFADLDSLTNGLHPGQLIVLAARPGIGKSTAALDFARATSIKHGMASVVFSLEMSRIEITMRLLSAEARVHLQNMRNGRMSEDDWGRLARRMGEIASAPLFIDDSPGLNMMELRAKCRRLKQKHDLKLVVVDYLQLMTPGKRSDSRQQEVSEMSRSLKLLAKEIGVPVVALSQLNRQAETRSDKKPQLSDLRESGAIEQDADVVILLHRDDAYEKESPRAGEADFIVAKHRNGPTDTVTVAFQGHYSRFVDMRRD
jgi:replicative DNA helicase